MSNCCLVAKHVSQSLIVSLFAHADQKGHYIFSSRERILLGSAGITFHDVMGCNFRFLDSFQEIREESWKAYHGNVQSAEVKPEVLPILNKENIQRQRNANRLPRNLANPGIANSARVQVSFVPCVIPTLVLSKTQHILHTTLNFCELCVSSKELIMLVVQGIALIT